MIPDELCHYTTRETALEKILSTKKIKMSNLGLTNDPKESKSRQEIIIADIDKQIRRKIFLINKRAEKIRKDEWKVFCLTKSLPKLKNENRENIYRNYFTPGYSRPRMWAQYAENHSGVCLVFNGERLSKTFDSLLNKKYIIFHGSVCYENYDVVPSKVIDYSNIEKLGLTEAIRKFYYDNFEYYFLSKHSDWRDETEYRWLFYNPTKGKMDEFINIEGALTAVIVGIDFPQVYEPSLKALCKDLNIPAGKMKWENGVPVPNLEKIYNPLEDG
ncbi:MAG: DUF2971 domain-containing protein [Anaerolineaceae bacterium]|nr:MAG: DUF2971 domain-containing protein [Anaerolineaceae bacterium]